MNLKYIMLCVSMSFNLQKTDSFADSDSVNQGSNPCPSANEYRGLTATAVSSFCFRRHRSTKTLS